VEDPLELSSLLRESVQAMSSTAQSITSLTNDGVLRDVKLFDGDVAAWPTFALQMKSIYRTRGENAAFRVIQDKIGGPPAALIQGLELTTFTEVMQALQAAYDPVGNPIDALSRFSKLRQGANSILNHNISVGSLICKMGKNVRTTEEMIVAQYVESIDDEQIRRKLHVKLSYATKGSTGSTTYPSLHTMMNLAQDCERLNVRVKRTNQDSDPSGLINATSGSDSGSQINAFNPGGRQFIRGKRTGAPANTPTPNIDSDGFKKPMWCDIHETHSHDTKTCRQLNAVFCWFCKKDVVQGKMVEHTKVCGALRCHNCNKRGHKAINCGKPKVFKGDKRSTAPSGTQGRQNTSDTTASKVHAVDTTTTPTIAPTPAPTAVAATTTDTAATPSIN
jgi:hypothetical protein